MIAILLFILLLSKISCHQMPTKPQHPGILQASHQESIHKKEIPRPSSSQIPVSLDNLSHLPNIQSQPDFIGRPELPSTSHLSPRELLANMRSRMSSPLTLPSTPAEFEESIGNCKRMIGLHPYTSFNSQIGSVLGANSIPRGNGVSIPSSQGSIEYIPQLYPPQSSSPGAELLSMFPSELALYKNMPEAALQNSLAGKTADSQAFTSTNSFGLQKSNLIPKNSQSPLEPISTGQATADPFLSSLTASLPSPVIPSQTKSSRLTIPSPLSLMDSPPVYSYDVPAHTFGISEPILTSTVGCLELTVTPYGTISETPLPDSSIPLPRSPFLPVASPVSALAPPFSPLLPSATPSAKSNSFLTKVPVPPPFV